MKKILFGLLFSLLAFQVQAAPIDLGDLNAAGILTTGAQTADANVAFDTEWSFDVSSVTGAKITFITTDSALPGSGVFDTTITVKNGVGATIFSDVIPATSGFTLYAASVAVDTYTFSMSSAGGLDPFGGSYSAVVQSVPVPAAVWLFGSALMGLVGASRRKSASVAA